MRRLSISAFATIVVAAALISCVRTVSSDPYDGVMPPLHHNAGINPPAYSDPLVAGDVAPRRIPHPGIESVLNRSAIARYVYVVDRTELELLVYPAGVPNPAPIRTISFSSQPIGVATDARGHVYVTLFGASKVAIFDSGAVHRIDTIGAAAGVNEPTGVVVDASGNLWVANRGNPSYVAEYAPAGSKAVHAEVPLPPLFVAAGIAMDKNGNLWVDMMASQGGFVVEYPPAQNAAAARIQVLSAAEAQAQLQQPPIGTAGNGGIAFDARGFLEVGTISDRMVFAPPDWKRVGFYYYGEGLTIHQMTAGEDGTLYVPFESHTGSPFVLVIPTASSEAPYRITQGLVLPSGAAAGV